MQQQNFSTSQRYFLLQKTVFEKPGFQGDVDKWGQFGTQNMFNDEAYHLVLTEVNDIGKFRNYGNSIPDLVVLETHRTRSGQMRNIYEPQKGNTPFAHVSRLLEEVYFCGVDFQYQF